MSTSGSSKFFTTTDPNKFPFSSLAVIPLSENSMVSKLRSSPLVKYPLKPKSSILFLSPVFSRYASLAPNSAFIKGITPCSVGPSILELKYMFPAFLYRSSTGIKSEGANAMSISKLGFVPLISRSTKTSFSRSIVPSILKSPCSIRMPDGCMLRSPEFSL